MPLYNFPCCTWASKVFLCLAPRHLLSSYHQNSWHWVAGETFKSPIIYFLFCEYRSTLWNGTSLEPAQQFHEAQPLSQKIRVFSWCSLFIISILFLLYIIFKSQGKMMPCTFYKLAFISFYLMSLFLTQLSTMKKTL